MTDDAANTQIVLNGEIYNYRELRKTLQQKGHTFRTASDTEVLLKSYLEWDVGCLERINGAFAFAIYDSRKHRVFLARDRAGEKPLFYRWSNGRLAFASELKALMLDETLSRRLNPEALDHYLAYGYVPGELCILKDVHKVPPAHALVYDVKGDTMRLWQYWSLPPVVSTGSVAHAEPLLEELADLLEDAVRLQLVADVPVGILLSGGIDSSLITAMAARASSGPVRTFTVAFPGNGSYDEGPYARLVATHFGTRHTELVAESATVDLLPELAKQYDEPLGDSSMIPTYIVSRLIRESCTVAIGGDGGDELFGGYTHYSRVQKLNEWRSLLPQFAYKAIGRASTVLPLGFRGRSYAASLAMPDVDSWIAPTMQFDVRTRRQLAPSTRHTKGMTPEEYRLWMGRAGTTPLQKMTAADFRTYLPEDILVKVDRASMLASLEVRAPFLDYRIIEFAFGKVPDALRATSTNRKVLLKMLASRLLPAALDLERKQGFSLPLSSWFSGPWGRYIEEILLAAPSDLYDPRTVRSLLKRKHANAQRLFNLAFLELWRREYGISVG
jgi:asparagine synthase (glutamine-hydrolysing)